MWYSVFWDVLRKKCSPGRDAVRCICGRERLWFSVDFLSTFLYCLYHSTFPVSKSVPARTARKQWAAICHLLQLLMSFAVTGWSLPRHHDNNMQTCPRLRQKDPSFFKSALRCWGVQMYGQTPLAPGQCWGHRGASLSFHDPPSQHCKAVPRLGKEKDGCLML